MTFIAAFTLSFLQNSGIKPKIIISPLSAKIDIFDRIKPLLNKFQNTYFLKKKTSLIPLSYAAVPYDNAAAYVVADFDTGEVIAEKAMSQKLPMASLTKIMTAIVALDLADPSESFTVSRHASQIEPTIMGVTYGETLTLHDLLEALLMTSANDAAEIIKENINQKYHQEVFIEAMNKKAQLMRLQNTGFTNPQGFDDFDHYSSAEDIAILSHYAISNYPLIAKIVKSDMTYLPQTLTHAEYKLPNWNGLLGVYPGVSGIKIGNTGKAGKTIAVVAQREGKKLIVVLLGANTIIERDLWTAGLLNLGFEETLGLAPFIVTENQLREKYNSWYL